MNDFLATYRDGSNWNFSWFSSEEEAQDWLDNESDGYEEVEVIELTFVRQLKRNE